MRTIKLLTVLVTTALTTVLLPGIMTAQSTNKPSPSTLHTISELGWMSGDWQTPPGRPAQIEEHWTQPAGGSMLGVSRTVIGIRTLEFEYLRLEQRPEGIFYVAHPKARCPGTDFKLTSVTTSEAVFENPQHDFPKRIIYRRTAEDTLTATIDGGERTKAISFVYKRMK